MQRSSSIFNLIKIKARASSPRFLIIGIVFFLSQPSQATLNCRLFSPIAQKIDYAHISVEERSARMIELPKLEEKIADQIFTGFLQQKMNLKNVNQCIATLPDWGRFNLSLQKEFFTRSYQRFQLASANKRLNIFYKMMGDISQDGQSFMFRLTGDAFGLAPTDQKAGFHRSSGSIFIDIEKTTADEWLVVFAHEMSHALDNLMFESIATTSNPATAHRLSELGQSAIKYDQMSPSDQELAKNWQRAEMDRGLFAEYRAWLVTVLIYQDGIATGLWKKIDWLENILSQKTKKESLQNFIYRYLNAHAYDVNEGLDGWPLMQDVRARLRASFVEDGGLLRLGSLNEIVDYTQH